MNNSLPIDPAKRQVLVNLGNRFVVFGPEGGLPEPIYFTPEHTAILPRVADENEIAETRIAETLQVAGLTRVALKREEAEDADVEFVDASGNRTLVDIKVRERDPKQRDLQVGTDKLNLAKSKNQNLEIWFFNIERLKLTIMRLDRVGVQFDNLMPLNVWEKTSEGIFERKRVVDEVDDWFRRVERLYANVREWLSDRGDLRFEESRIVTMSEEMMQKFAVTDREMAVLDVLRGDQVITSFVPRGLWLIGAWGRIDVITKDKTSILVAIRKPDEFEWKLVAPENRRHRKVFDKSALVELMSGL